MKMISNRPYLMRAMYDWIVDNEWTPHLQIDANFPGVDAPTEYADEGVLILNISPEAVMFFRIENDWISFQARFGGIERKVGFPPESVLAIFAKENGHGMPFSPEPYPEEPPKPKEGKSADKPKRPHLSVVK